jgi:hypothetical protein
MNRSGTNPSVAEGLGSTAIVSRDLRGPIDRCVPSSLILAHVLQLGNKNVSECAMG